MRGAANSRAFSDKKVEGVKSGEKLIGIVIAKVQKQQQENNSCQECREFSYLQKGM